MPFVLLVLALLGGSLICLLVINTTLGASSFRITELQGTNASLSQQHQALQQLIANEEAPGQIARRAYALGMRWQSQLNYIDPVTGRIYRVGVRGPGIVDPFVPARVAKSEHRANGNGRAKRSATVRSGRTAKAGGKSTAGTKGRRNARKTRARSGQGGTTRPGTKARAGSA